MKILHWTYLSLFLSFVISFLIFNRRLITANKDYVTILISTIASVSSLAAVLFSLFLYFKEKKQNKVKLSFHTEIPLYDVRDNTWINFKIHNFGNSTAINPHLTLYILNNGSFEKIYSGGYLYSMLENHYFNFYFDDNMPKLTVESKLVAKITYTDDSTQEQESQIFPFSLTRKIQKRIDTGEEKEIPALFPTCLSIEHHKEIISSFNSIK